MVGADVGMPGTVTHEPAQGATGWGAAG